MIEKNARPRHKASITILSPKLEISEINKLLGITPSSYSDKGSPLNKRNPEGRKRPASSWILESDLDSMSDLDAHIEYLLSIVEQKKQEFQELSNNSCKLEIFCGIFLADEDYGGSFTLSSTLIKRLTILPLDIIVITHPPDQC